MSASTVFQLQMFGMLVTTVSLPLSVDYCQLLSLEKGSRVRWPRFRGDPVQLKIKKGYSVEYPKKLNCADETERLNLTRWTVAIANESRS
jgi:hypothetical protein